ncbi:twin-arginine translocation pathway signal precursor [Azorhizobium caulinodans ORS 571]|uniref:Twin-arginine translocation pathway signal n=1 Tax=Azorhizobium caulinodans (strain ATCC 43989 / DSM 5975 / JCM 20966 / LMG 6465 / NBRC 14845 / NCIMB 13405 / ORS 571) TaxID=438753 RepID=A8ICY9_AZOC5|nr:arylsulfatase [Azorhizobium caulinodans]BAF88859.1 twin-arginine translocation pathway signal precursor [Azorhizobium caulinodans ORS 571]
MTDTHRNETEAGPSRRDVLAGTAGFMAAVAGLSALASPARAQAAPRPHILYILADDLGFADVGFHGSDIKTPNLDKLAATGATLGQFYTQPMCTPTRAALMTGRYPLRYGLQTGVIPSGASYGLATDEFLLPQALKSVGYSTALIGKWHLGHAKQDFWPRQRGFDYFYGPLVGEIDHYKHEAHGVVDWYRDNKQVVEEGYDTELFGTDAARLIGAHDPKTPLFLYLAFTAPHTPFQAPQAYVDRYPNITDPARRLYAAMISAMDDQIGKVVAALEQRGMRENTLIVFHSDNGGTRSKMFVGEGAFHGELPASNAPYRDGKGTLYEGGTRVAALANWPGRITPGAADGVMHVVDMMPTLARLAGANLDRSKPLDGVDVWSALSSARTSPRDGVVYNVEPTQGAVREGNWKLYWHALLPPKVELYDLAKDPSETTDVAAQHPEKVAALQAHVVDLARTMAPPLFYAAALKAALSAPLSTPTGALYGLGMEDD